MAGSQQSWNKKEREKKKQKERQEKAAKKQERKQSGGKGFDDMMAYIDEHGNLTSTPPDPSKRVEVKLEDIVIGVPKAAPEDEADKIRSGIVSFFNSGKGFGFIKDLQTQESFFVHINACLDRIEENSKVNFELERGPRGYQAVRVTLVK